ncbi:hypothetical protein B0T20DRAFT_178817 [Sordaria brevicollis]|uniref:Secreted protein n=1 Tax=Sordaria brevicollis TaxID=83679 RepID=A0AAE0UDV1_SORBR|nr:hypothetical protein B0T20DRAFT_178817 [Sordaria brevicollis]
MPDKLARLVAAVTLWFHSLCKSCWSFQPGWFGLAPQICHGRVDNTRIVLPLAWRGLVFPLDEALFVTKRNWESFNDEYMKGTGRKF